MINFENIRNFTYSNHHLINGDIKGICVFFMGLCNSSMYDEKWKDPQIDRAKMFAEKNILYLIPYLNPWNWMNDEAIATTNEILSALISGLGLPDNIGIVSTGDSMGGMSSLVYTRYSPFNIVSCIPNCPVCDFVYHLGERFDLPRTIYSAYRSYDNFDEALKSHSPLHLADEMPDIEYHFFHCGEDSAVNIEKHTQKMVQQLKKNHSVTLDIAEGRDHCDLTSELTDKLNGYVLSSLGIN